MPSESIPTRAGRSRTRPFDAVLFDLDGTLVDTSGDLVTAINETLSTYDLDPLLRPAVLAHVGHGVRSLVERCLQDERGVTLDEIGGLDHAVGRFRDCYANHLLDTTRPYPGIIEMCDRLLAKGIALGVVTNKVEDLSRRIIEGLGLSGRFRVILGGDSLPVRKPDPSSILHALDGMNVSIERAAMVGDSPIDIEAARRAGIRVAAVTWGFVSGESLKKAAPDHLADDPARLEAWLLGE